jgi:hypothetical protein
VSHKSDAHFLKRESQRKCALTYWQAEYTKTGRLRDFPVEAVAFWWYKRVDSNKFIPMKSKLALALSIVLSTSSALGQGVIVVNPVPVTNGITGALADSSIIAALYFGPAGGSENSMQLLSLAAPLVNGRAQFGSQTIIPAFPPGASMQLGVRAWSSGYLSYESAIASGLPSVLAGKSVLLTATLGGPPPAPSTLNFPGFTVYAVRSLPCRCSH